MEACGGGASLADTPGAGTTLGAASGFGGAFAGPADAGTDSVAVRWPNDGIGVRCGVIVLPTRTCCNPPTITESSGLSPCSMTRSPSS